MTVTASRYARVENDLYQTEPWVTEALLERFPVADMDVWEPAAGNHLMADVLKETARVVITSDIVEYDRPQDRLYDFLKLHNEWPLVDAIVTNPPYGHGNRQAVRLLKMP